MVLLRKLSLPLLHGVSFHLSVEDVTCIVDIPLGGWDLYLKFDWPSLDNMSSILAITRKFLGNPNLVQHR